MEARKFKERTIVDFKIEASEPVSSAQGCEGVASLDFCHGYGLGKQPPRTKFDDTASSLEPANANGPAAKSSPGVSLQITAHPYLVDAMFDLSSEPPRWIGRGHVRVCALAGGVHEVRAVVEADEAGTTALVQAGFQIKIAAAGEHIKRTSATSGHSK